MKKRILIIVGARPNFIKVTQFKKVAAQFPDLEVKILHTGQHSDSNMSDIFFKQFNLIPDFSLFIEANSAVSQIGEIIKGCEAIFSNYNPHLLIVVGDVNSTLAAAIAANKMKIKLAHLESGLRSFDREMPEEINRILTDQLTDLFFITEEVAVENLTKEGVKPENIFFVGNTMIDTLVAFESSIEKDPVLADLKIESSQQYVLMTMHRPSNVDTAEGLLSIVNLVTELSKQYKVVFPIHPRTLNNIKKFELYESLLAIGNKLITTGPLSYFAFQRLIKSAAFVVTDSGGVQEETTFRKVPCITLRKNTERPITVTTGSNTMSYFDIFEIKKIVDQIASGNYKNGAIPPLWDGKATDRALAIIHEFLK